MCHSFFSKLGAPIAGVALCLFALASARPALATLIRVDFSASVSGDMGSGTLSGSLGEFDVSAVGDEFLLPADGSILVTTSGFTNGVPNGTFGFEGETGGPAFRFTSLDPVAGEIVMTSPQGGGGDGLGVRVWDCTVVLDTGTTDSCIIAIGDTMPLPGYDEAAIMGLDEPPYSLGDSVGELSYDFTIVPEPSTALLLGFGLVGLAAARRRCKRRLAA